MNTNTLNKTHINITKYVLEIPGTDTRGVSNRHVCRYFWHQNVCSAFGPETRFGLIKGHGTMKLIVLSDCENPNYNLYWSETTLRQEVSVDMSRVKRVRLIGNASVVIKQNGKCKSISIGQVHDKIVKWLEMHGLSNVELNINVDRTDIKRRGEHVSYVYNTFDAKCDFDVEKIDALQELLLNGIGKRKHLGLGMVLLVGVQT